MTTETAGITTRDITLARNLYYGSDAGDDYEQAALNDLCARLDIDPDETEQGLTKDAAERIDTFVQLVLIGAEMVAFPAEVENDLEDRGLIVQTDAPYATLTAAGIAALKKETT